MPLKCTHTDAVKDNIKPCVPLFMLLVPTVKPKLCVSTKIGDLAFTDLRKQGTDLSQIFASINTHSGLFLRPCVGLRCVSQVLAELCSSVKKFLQ